MGYISELRKVVGTQPLMMPGSCVVILNDAREILLQKRSDSLDWGTIGGALELGESFEEAGLKAEQFRFVSLLSGADMYFRYPPGDEIYNISRLVLTKAGYLTKDEPDE
jgi:8-oxo-dGTP pyrophosphatase MutT (NUDIX family)